MTREGQFLAAALAAVDRAWAVFPLRPDSKKPALHGDTSDRPCPRIGPCRDGHLGWEQRATTDMRRVSRWWTENPTSNVGIATGKSGLIVVDLDSGNGSCPPARFAGAQNGRDVLAMLAAEAGAEVPTDTYAVETPNGRHLYFLAPAGFELRNTTGRLGWRMDTRAHGGYVVAAGSQRDEGKYRVIHPGPVTELPDWLLGALTPPPREPRPLMRLSRRRATAYVHAIVESEAHDVGAAQTGARHDTLLRAARTLGRLVAGNELDEDDVRRVLLDAAARHIGVDDCTADEVTRTIEDGLTYGKQLPRRIGHDPRHGPSSTDQTPRAG